MTTEAMESIPLSPTPIDIHLIAAALVHERQSLDPKFQAFRLAEVIHGNFDLPPTSPPQLRRLWSQDDRLKRKKLFLVLHELFDKSPYHQQPVTPKTFPSDADGTVSVDLVPTKLSLTELEDLFYRVRNHDSCNEMLKALEILLERFDEQQVFVAKTARGDQVEFTKSEVTYMSFSVVPKEATLMWTSKQLESSKGMSKSHVKAVSTFYETGVIVPDDGCHHVVAMLGKPPSNSGHEDKRIVLDLTGLQYGTRGYGGELFFCDNTQEYTETLGADLVDGKLCRGVADFKGPPRERAEELAVKVLDRICRMIVAGKEGTAAVGMICEYCGGPGMRRCGKCKASFFCDGDCQKSGWKRHKKWCKAS
ncbi:hypothetical protein HK102_006421 [Quaeritorhiza haematococci]|nr:hypothetical protein HK102_006421 [Quaeritorhiza haematococci]